MNLETIITNDGSHSLRRKEINETYHSSHGAIQESKHIFIHSALKQTTLTEINVFEIGFGTGLNALLTSYYSTNNNLKINYTTIEKYPIDIELIKTLNYPSLLNKEAEDVFSKLHTLSWNTEHQVSKNFKFCKIQADFTSYIHTDQYDIIFMDAFSPDKQPEMWSENLMRSLYLHCNTGAILTTYCAKGSVRRTLQVAGFKVERIPGPPGKREILRALKE